jgi:hypothetical protein
MKALIVMFKREVYAKQDETE